MEHGLLQVVDMLLGEYIEDTIEGGDPARYYAFKSHDQKAIFTVTLDVMFGEPDLFVSTAGPPSVLDYMWCSISSFGDNRIVIDTKDPNYLPCGPYYIAVCSHDDCAFRILVTQNIGDVKETPSMSRVDAVTNKMNAIATGKITHDGVSTSPVASSSPSTSNDDRIFKSNFPVWTKTEADEEDAAYNEMLLQLQGRESTAKKFFDPKLLSAMKLHLNASGLNSDDLSNTEWTNALKEDVKSAVTIWGPGALKYILAREIQSSQDHRATRGGEDDDNFLHQQREARPKTQADKKRHNIVYKYRNPPRYVPAWHSLLRMPSPPVYSITNTSRAMTPGGVHYLTQKLKPGEGLTLHAGKQRKKHKNNASLAQKDKASYFVDVGAVLGFST